VVNTTPRPLYPRKSLSGHLGRYGLVRKISPPHEFDPQTVQAVACRYTITQGNAGLFQALRFLRGSGSQISRQSAHEGVKVVGLTPQQPLLPSNIPDTHLYQRQSRPQTHTALGRIISNISMTPTGIESATFRLVAQCLNRLHDGTYDI